MKVGLDVLEGMVESAEEPATKLFQNVAHVRIIKVPSVPVSKATLSRFGRGKMRHNGREYDRVLH
jgi:hypothetical protein